jgi:hypothetical protein
MNGQKYESLSQLLGCYFHQDWPDEFDDDTAAFKAIVTNEPDEQIKKSLVEIDLLLSPELNEEERKAFLIDQIGCCFDPASEHLSCSQWLHRLRSSLQQTQGSVLLSIDEIRAGLEREFLPLEPMLTGFRLIESTPSEGTIASAEKAVATNFPKDFRELIARFDFGNLTIGPVVFGTSGDYLGEIIELNERAGWWGRAERPTDLLMIANSDPFAILLDCRSGSVYSSDVESGWQKARKIADNFSTFLVGLGTTVLKRFGTHDRYGLANAIAKRVGNDHPEFWLNLAK